MSEVLVGQVYKDNDPRSVGRHVMVLDASLETVAEVQAAYRVGSEWHAYPRGRKTKIRKTSFGKTGRVGFTLVYDPSPPPPSDMEDLIERLCRAIAVLERDGSTPRMRGTETGARLLHKAEGVRLALSYAEEYVRVARRSVPPPATLRGSSQAAEGAAGS